MKRINTYRSLCGFLVSSLSASIGLTVVYFVSEVVQARTNHTLPLDRDILYAGWSHFLCDPFWIYLVTAFFCILFYLKFRKSISCSFPKQDIHFITYVRFLIFSAAIGYLSRFLFSCAMDFMVASEFLDLKTITAMTTQFSDDPFWRILQTIVVVLIVPVYEELIFRQTLMNDMRSKYSTKKTIWLSCLGFVCMHWNGNIIYAFVVGAVTVYAYAKYGRLALTIFIHSVFNLIGCIEINYESLPLGVEQFVLGLSIGISVYYICTYILPSFGKGFRRRP